METYGGAERVTQELARAYPEAPVVAILGRRDVASRMGVADRFTSLLPARPRLLRHYRLLAPVFPAVAAAAGLPEADVVLSSSYAFAHRMTAPGAARVCYCHSPLRFAWSMTEDYADRVASGRARTAAFGALAAGMRATDRRAARAVDAYLTQSPFTADQIDRFYGIRAQVVGAPVDCELFRPSGRPPEEFLLLCGRLVEPYKRVGMTLEAVRGTGRRVVVAGDGPALEELRAAAPPEVEFVGHQDDAALVHLMQTCAAAIFPSRDDFGLIPVEVMACGRPVLAYGEGGALYTVREGVTGAFFSEQTAPALASALREFDPGDYDPDAIRAHALQWDREAFRERVMAAVEAAATAG